MNPASNAVVFSFDEKSQIQALERVQPILPMDIGQPERQNHNYIRNGTLDLFAAASSVIGPRTSWSSFARSRSGWEPGLQIHVVLDNLSAHKTPAVRQWLIRHPRVEFHFTPT